MKCVLCGARSKVKLRGKGCVCLRHRSLIRQYIRNRREDVEFLECIPSDRLPKWLRRELMDIDTKLAFFKKGVEMTNYEFIFDKQRDEMIRELARNVVARVAVIKYGLVGCVGRIKNEWIVDELKEIASLDPAYVTS